MQIRRRRYQWWVGRPTYIDDFSPIAILGHELSEGVLGEYDLGRFTTGDMPEVFRDTGCGRPAAASFNNGRKADLATATTLRYVVQFTNMITSPGPGRILSATFPSRAWTLTRVAVLSRQVCWREATPEIA